MAANRILVTGACGFIGSHLCEMLVKKGCKVIGFDRYNSTNDWGWLDQSEVRDDVEVILGDIRDYDSVNRAVSKCDDIFHLAALIGIPYSYVSPLAYIKTNIEGTYNVLESARNNCIDQVLITSTSEVYGSAQTVPINENHPIVGQSPYAASKISADQLAESYYRSFNLRVKIVRPFNTYGPRQSTRAIIPTIISQLFADTGEMVLGNVNPTRDLTYVTDTCTAMYEILQSREFYGDVVNIGMNKEISIGDLAVKIGQLMNRKVQLTEDNIRKRPPGSEVDRLVCDNYKLMSLTSWTPMDTLETGLNKTINWFASQVSRSDKKGITYQV